jgi:hypothetical protein
MMLEKKPFINYTLEEDKKDDDSKVFTFRLNKEEQENLKECMLLLQQEKVSTALKQLANLGMFVLHERSMAHILGVLADNLRKNKRIGIEEVEVRNL